jgi:hypothetical protein
MVNAIVLILAIYGACRLVDRWIDRWVNWWLDDIPSTKHGERAVAYSDPPNRTPMIADLAE